MTDIIYVTCISYQNKTKENKCSFGMFSDSLQSFSVMGWLSCYSDWWQRVNITTITYAICISFISTLSRLHSTFYRLWEGKRGEEMSQFFLSSMLEWMLKLHLFLGLCEILPILFYSLELWSLPYHVNSNTSDSDQTGRILWGFLEDSLGIFLASGFFETWARLLEESQRLIIHQDSLCWIYWKCSKFRNHFYLVVEGERDSLLIQYQRFCIRKTEIFKSFVIVLSRFWFYEPKPAFCNLVDKTTLSVRVLL